jgi:hypothetical protein
MFSPHRKRGVFSVLLGMAVSMASWAQAAPELAVGTVRGSPAATVSLPLYFTAGGTAVAGLQLDLRFEAARLGSGTPAPGSALSDHVLFHSVPEAGTFRAVLYSLARAPLSGGVLMSVPLTISASASPGDLGLVIEDVVLSDGTAVKIEPASLGPGAVKVVLAPTVGQELAFQGSVSDGRPDHTSLRLSGLPELEVRYRLTAPAIGSCQVKLTVVQPDGTRLGPLVLGQAGQLLQAGGQEGNWTFLVSGSGGCSGQSFELRIRGGTALVGIGSGAFLLAVLLFLANSPLTRRRRLPAS